MGTLYLVATPIGNLGDLSPRAQQCLGAVAVIAAEDTRTTARLLEAYGIDTPMISFYEKNEERRVPELCARLAQGDDVALVTDAGTPAVSDPGFRLVRGALAAGARVVPIPGPSAVLAALVGSGLSTARFRFEGFLPRGQGERRHRLERLDRDEATLILFEAPGRVAALLEDVAATLGPDRPVVVARELTKLHEEFLRGTAAELAEKLEAAPPRGEVTVVVGPRPAPGQAERQQAGDALEQALAQALASGLSPRDIYQRAIDVKKRRG